MYPLMKVTSIMEAELIKIYLISEGINAKLSGDKFAQSNPVIGLVTGIEILIPTIELERAKEAMTNYKKL